MKLFVGLNEYALRRKGESVPVYYNPHELKTGHTLICGDSGTGKSHQSRRFLNAASRSGIMIDVFDVHEEFGGLPLSTTCKYSQATGYGYNPLVLDTDPHTGGVDRQINFFVGLIKSSTPQFGAKQEAALRYLLTDTYAANGIFQNSPSTWHRKMLTEKTRDEIVKQRNWSELRKYYPTMEDLRSYARRKIIALTIGGDNKCVSSFDRLSRQKHRLNSIMNKWSRSADESEKAGLESKIAELKETCISTYGEFIESMETGRELDDIIKYDSVDVLKSVLQRIDILNAAGIFRANEPPFDDAVVRVHDIKSLDNSADVMLVKLRLRALFDEHKRRGETDTIRHIAFLEEGHKYFTKDEEDIINKISKEARKFGLVLWCSSQSPTTFPESFMANVGATVLLGIHTMYWKSAANLLRISEDFLKWIRPREVISIKLSKIGQSDPPFVNVQVPTPQSEGGRTAASFESAGPELS